MEVPDLRIKPEYGEYYYLVNPLSDDFFIRCKCTENSSEELWIKRGLAYQDSEEGKQAAILHAKTWLGIA